MPPKSRKRCQERGAGSAGKGNWATTRIRRILIHLPHETAGRFSSCERQAPILLPGQGPGPAPRLLPPSWRSLGGTGGVDKRATRLFIQTQWHPNGARRRPQGCPYRPTGAPMAKACPESVVDFIAMSGVYFVEAATHALALGCSPRLLPRPPS